MRPQTAWPLFQTVIHAATEIKSSKTSFLLPTLSPNIKPSYSTSLDEALRNDILPQQPFLQPNGPSTSNEPHLQWVLRHTTSAYRSSSKSRFPLLPPLKASVPQQNSTVSKFIRRPSHQLSSHTLDGFLLPQTNPEYQ